MSPASTATSAATTVAANQARQCVGNSLKGPADVAKARNEPRPVLLASDAPNTAHNDTAHPSKTYISASPSDSFTIVSLPETWATPSDDPYGGAGGRPRHGRKQVTTHGPAT
ncbi:hypothetical protein GCM10012289_42460 [Nonomuraea cavernae]|uniref:Uncharacterized protein n=1 Tax=Nonomuraea cavernae TaxID=2045107 RepID=A0A917Z2H8_9ACTN|nr:hypothetical protein GCM10012289_42460 [Nonomuraea cavernae]